MIGLHASNSSSQNLRGLGELLRDCCQLSGRKVAGITTLDLRLVNELQFVEHWGFRTQKTRWPGGDGDNPTPDEVYADPDLVARRWIDLCVPFWRLNLNPSPTFFIMANEQDPQDIEHALLYDRYTLEAMRYYDETYRAALGGVPLGIYAFSAGCPTQGPHGNDWAIEDMWEALLPSTRYAFEHGHWICLHNHGGRFGTLEASGEYQALRHRRAVAFWEAQGLDLSKCRIDLSETSNSAGGVEPDLMTYISSVHWLLDQLIAERTATWPGVKFFSLYQFGGAGERLQDAIPAIIQLHIDHPLPPIEPPPPDDPLAYDRVYNLLSKSATYAQRIAVDFDADPRGETVGRSIHDAFITSPHLKSRTVIVWNVDEFAEFHGDRRELEEWVAANFGPLPTIVYRTLP